VPTFPVGTYQVTFPAGKDEPVRICFRDEGNHPRGQIDFIPAAAIGRRCVFRDDGFVTAFMPLDCLAPVLAILRHERPMFFVVDPERMTAALKTGEEPPGESERS
jgi:hypothetical protein